MNYRHTRMTFFFFSSIKHSDCQAIFFRKGIRKMCESFSLLVASSCYYSLFKLCSLFLCAAIDKSYLCSHHRPAAVNSLFPLFFLFRPLAPVIKKKKNQLRSHTSTVKQLNYLHSARLKNKIYSFKIKK